MALIYIVEDDSDIREIETIAMKNSNHVVFAFENARDFMQKMASVLPDLVILDILLPDKNGYEILRQMRADVRTRQIPVIMVTAKTTEMDMLRGLDGGADDYIYKPFSVMELMTRVKVVLRRCHHDEEDVLRVGKITLNREKYTVHVDNNRIELTYKEYELLALLMANADVVLSRDVIMLEVWGTDFEGESRTVDMHIKTLRKKLGSEGARIRTVRNVGYSIESGDAENETQD